VVRAENTLYGSTAAGKIEKRIPLTENLDGPTATLLRASTARSCSAAHARSSCTVTGCGWNMVKRNPGECRASATERFPPAGLVIPY